MLRRGLNHWGIFDYVLDKVILIGEKKLKDTKIKEVYFTTKDNIKMVSGRAPPSHIGIMVGHLNRRSFMPSMAGADLIARIGVDFPFVRVNKAAEALVLYGRDIMCVSVVDYGNLNKDNRNNHNNIVVIILNEDKVAIGLGITLVPFGKNIQTSDNKIVIKTIMDAGHYLRNERWVE